MVSCSVSFGNTSKRDNNHEIALRFRRNEWSDKAKSLYMKYHRTPGNVNSEKVGCEYYIFSEMESQELYVRWRHYIMGTTRNFVFGSGLIDNFTNTVQKRYQQEFKFKAG